MGVNVFDDCVDDEDVLFGYEHNDTAAAAISLPNIRDILQICDYDDDYFTFTVEQTETVRLDLIFTDREGDLDMTLEGETENSLRSWSFNDDEVIEAELEPGTYTVRIFGYGDDQNTYRLFKTNGIVSTTTVELSGDGREIPDYADRMAGVLRCRHHRGCAHRKHYPNAQDQEHGPEPRVFDRPASHRALGRRTYRSPLGPRRGNKWRRWWFR